MTRKQSAPPKPAPAPEEPSPPNGPAGELNLANLEYLEALYDQYLQDPQRLPESWRRYFDELASGQAGQKPATRRPSFRPRSIFDPGGAETRAADEAGDASNGRPARAAAPAPAADDLQLSRLQERVD